MARSAVQLGLLKLRSRLQGWSRDRNSRAKSYGCPDSEPCRVMRDIGLRGRELNAPEYSHPGPGELKPQRLERLGLDPGNVKSFHESIYQDL